MFRLWTFRTFQVLSERFLHLEPTILVQVRKKQPFRSWREGRTRLGSRLC